MADIEYEGARGRAGEEWKRRLRASREQQLGEELGERERNPWGRVCEEEKWADAVDWLGPQNHGIITELEGIRGSIPRNHPWIQRVFCSRW